MLDISTDYAIFDGIQAVTLHSRQDDENYTEVAYTGTGLKHEVDAIDTVSASDGFGTLINHSVVWDVYQASLSSAIIPTVGDKLTATVIGGSQDFLITKVEYIDFSSTFRLTTDQIGQGR